MSWRVSKGGQITLHQRRIAMGHQDFSSARPARRVQL
jgi:hypothetical protein